MMYTRPAFRHMRICRRMKESVVILVNLKINLSTDFSRLRDVCVITEKDFAERLRLQEAALDSLALQRNRN